MFVDMVRLWNRGIEAQRMLTETWSSAASVVSHRSDTIAKAIENPMTGDYRELTQMVGEKVEADDRIRGRGHGRLGAVAAFVVGACLSDDGRLHGCQVA